MISPYNELWMDCVTNNLIAMLASQNEAFLKFPCYMDTIYLRKVFNQSYSSEGIQEDLMSNGAYFPKIQYSLELLNNYIDHEFEEINQDCQSIHNIIKSKIDDGYCLFILVDRFFYPSGLDANTSHMIHPTFIYGYNNDNQSYMALEDCVMMGKMDYYSIPYSSIEKSSQYITSLGRAISLNFCKTNESSKEFNGEIPILQVINSLEKMLQGGQIYNKEYDLYYHCGLDSLSTFSNEISTFFYKLTDKNTFRTRALSFCQYHKRNQDVVTLISKYYDINMGEIKLYYEQLYKKWFVFKNKSNYILEKRMFSGIHISKDDLAWLNFNLNEIIDLERRTMERMWFLCREY
ncbi:hypothetical protein ABIE27_002561 [Paenibacillus sp. 4624]|nr:hypothetical protein [Paenibacillus amylolyticus]